MTSINPETEELVEPSISVVTQMDDSPTNSVVPTKRFFLAGGGTTNIYARNQWTRPRHYPELEERCSKAAGALLDPENVTPERQIKLLGSIAAMEREAGTPYVRAELNLIVGYLKIKRYQDAFQVAKQLAADEPSLEILIKERADIWMNLGISALRFSQVSESAADAEGLLETASQSYARANEFAEGKRLGVLCWWARVELARGNNERAEDLWHTGRALLLERPELTSDLQSILNKDDVLNALDVRLTTEKGN